MPKLIAICKVARLQGCKVHRRVLSYTHRSRCVFVPKLIAICKIARCKIARFIGERGVFTQQWRRLTATPQLTDNANKYETLFTGVTISNIAPAFITSADESVTFAGTYAPIEIPGTGDNSKLCIEGGSTVYNPRSEMTIGCQRAYFQLNDITTGQSDSDVKAVIVNFGGDNTTTGITTIQPANAYDTWFDLSGRKLSRRPTSSGIYILNGRKKVLK